MINRICGRFQTKAQKLKFDYCNVLPKTNKSFQSNSRKEKLKVDEKRKKLTNILPEIKH